MQTCQRCKPESNQDKTSEKPKLKIVFKSVKTLTVKKNIEELCPVERALKAQGNSVLLL